ncbi:unnamed protein product [Closterium sp. NIES-64]|nr:unnamed protein product [Closterium sp. NIES-64]
MGRGPATPSDRGHRHPIAAPPPRRGPAAQIAAPPPATQRPRHLLDAALPPASRRLRHGPAARYAAGPAARYAAAPPPAQPRLRRPLCRPRRSTSRGPAVPAAAPAGPATSAPLPLISRPRHPTCSSRAAHLKQLSSSAAEPPCRRAAREPSRPAPEPPCRRAAREPSRPAPELPCRRAAREPSRPAPERPCRRAAREQSRPAPQPPCRRAAREPSRPAAEPPLCRVARPALPGEHSPTVTACSSPTACTASLSSSWLPLVVLAFDAEGRAIDFEVWVDDLQLFLQCDRADGLSLFDLTSGASPAPAADADPTVRSQWATRDAAARLAVRCHLPTSERAHFSQYKSAQTLYDAVVARYSSPSTAALSRLMLPYLFPDLSAFPTVADLITHLRTSDTCYRAALPAEGALLPPCCPLLPLLLLPTCLVLSRSARRLPLVGDVALARARGARARVELEGAVAVAAEAAEGVGVAAGVVAGVVVAVAAAAEAAVVVAAVVVVAAAEVEAAEEAAEEAVVVEEVELVGVVPSSGAAVVVASARSSSSSSASRDIPPPQQLREWYTQRQRGGGTGPCTYVLRSGDRAGEQCGGAHPTQRCFGRLTDAWRQQFPGASEIPRWDELLRAGPDPGIGTAALGACEAAALGASASALSGTGETAPSGTASPSSSLTFTLDSGASRSFFRDRTTLTPLSRPVAVSLADPSGGPVLSHFSTVLPCPAAPSGTLSGLYLPSFSTNLVSGADLQDVGVHQFTPASQRVTHCTEARTGRHLATFSRRPGSSLYTLTVESPPVPASGQVAASGQVLAAASRLSLPFPPGQDLPVSPVSRVASGLLLTPPSSPRPRLLCRRFTWTCGAQPPSVGRVTSATFLLVVDDYSRYTTVLPLRSKGAVTEVLIDWIREARLQLRKSFGSDFPVLRLHSDRGGEFSSRLLRDYCRARGIRQTFTLPDSPQQNGIAERRIGMVMDVARTSMMHAAAPHFLWPFAVRYAAHQLNLHPRVSRPAMSPVLLWTGKVGDASTFRVWGSRAFVRDLSADKLSPRAAPCVFLGFPTDAPGWQFYHPSSRRVLSSQDVTFDESVPFYRLFPYRTPSLPPPPDFLVDAVDPVEVTGDSGAAAGAEPGGANSGGAVRGGAGPGGAATGGAEPGGAGPGDTTAEGAAPGGAVPGAAEPGGAESGAAEPGGAEPGVSPAAASRREPLSPQELREWFARRWRRAAGAGASSTVEGAGAAGPGAAGPAGPPGAGAAEGVGAETTAVCPLGGSAAGTAGGPAAGGVGGAGTVAEGAGAVPAESGAAARPRPYFVPLLQQVLGLSPQVLLSVVSLRLVPRRLFVLLALVVAGSRQRPPPVPGTHRMSLRPSTAPLRAPLPSPPESSLPALADPESDSLRAASPTVTRLLATVVTDPSFESTAASALVAELVDFAARCHIPTPRSYAEAVEGPYSSQWQAAMDAEMASWKSTGTYVDAVPPPGANIVSGMWIFRVKRPPGSPPVFKARYVARGFSQRQGVDYFQTFSPTPKMTTLRVLLHIAAQRDYELHSLDFSTAFLQGSLHEEIWLRRPPGFTGTFPPGTQWSLRRPVYGLRQAPREWHDTLRTTLAALGFAPSTADPSLFLRTDTSSAAVLHPRVRRRLGLCHSGHCWTRLREVRAAEETHVHRPG